MEKKELQFHLDWILKKGEELSEFEAKYKKSKSTTTYNSYQTIREQIKNYIIKRGDLLYLINQNEGEFWFDELLMIGHCNFDMEQITNKMEEQINSVL